MARLRVVAKEFYITGRIRYVTFRVYRGSKKVKEFLIRAGAGETWKHEAVMDLLGKPDGHIRHVGRKWVVCKYGPCPKESRPDDCNVKPLRVIETSWGGLLCVLGHKRVESRWPRWFVSDEVYFRLEVLCKADWRECKLYCWLRGLTDDTGGIERLARMFSDTRPAGRQEALECLLVLSALK